jgi:hypothetical protein
LLLLLYFGIGVFGSLTLPSYNNNNSSSIGGELSPSQSMESNLEKSIILFSFSTLISGFLYNYDPKAVSASPLGYHAIFMGVLRLCGGLDSSDREQLLRLKLPFKSTIMRVL